MTLSDAYLAAYGRGVLPTALASRDAREAFDLEVRRQSVFSARTTSVPYLSVLRDAIEHLLLTEKPDGESIGQAESRVRLKLALEAMHYDPEQGHFGIPSDATIPPARPGSMQDLSSDLRLNLIVDTQRTLYQNAARNTKAKEPITLHLFPCWELRPGRARKPREDWQARWVRVGGTLYDGRLIAPVGDPIWDRLGNGQTFKDALDTDTPPFAFGSKRRWRGVEREECLRLGITLPGNPGLKEALNPGAPPPEATHDLPTPKAVIPEDVNPTVEKSVTTTLKLGGDDDGELTYEKVRAASYEKARLARLAKQQKQ